MLELLTTEGHVVDCVSTARDALAYLSRGEGTVGYDLLLTDIGLPDGSGWDLVAETRTRWPALRIGVVTGWEGRSGSTTTADFVLRKPVRTKDLLDQISLGG
jgi:DNA-binding response OmpR family regulator